MKLIDKISGHYSKEVKRSLFVKEWDDTIYATPMTLSDQAKIDAKVQQKDGAGRDSIVYAIIDKVEDESGEKVFNLGHKDFLMKKVDAATLVKIGNWLSGSDVEDMEKN